MPDEGVRHWQRQVTLGAGHRSGTAWFGNLFPGSEDPAATIDDIQKCFPAPSTLMFKLGGSKLADEFIMAKRIQYDPFIIQKYADKLYSQASFVVAVATVFGFLVGSFLGYGVADFTRIGDENGKMLYTLIGAVVMCTIGCMLGFASALRLKFQAQMALCQKRVEENTQRPS